MLESNANFIFEPSYAGKSYTITLPNGEKIILNKDSIGYDSSKIIGHKTIFEGTQIPVYTGEKYSREYKTGEEELEPSDTCSAGKKYDDIHMSGKTNDIILKTLDGLFLYVNEQWYRFNKIGKTQATEYIYLGKVSEEDVLAAMADNIPGGNGSSLDRINNLMGLHRNKIKHTLQDPQFKAAVMQYRKGMEDVSEQILFDDVFGELKHKSNKGLSRRLSSKPDRKTFFNKLRTDKVFSDTFYNTLQQMCIYDADISRHGLTNKLAAGRWFVGYNTYLALCTDDTMVRLDNEDGREKFSWQQLRESFRVPEREYGPQDQSTFEEGKRILQELPFIYRILGLPTTISNSVPPSPPNVLEK